MFLLWGHAISWMACWHCSFSVTFYYYCVSDQCTVAGQYFEICAGRHNVFFSWVLGKNCEVLGRPAQHRPPWPHVQQCLRPTAPSFMKVMYVSIEEELWIIYSLRALETFGNCQRSVFSLGVSQHMHKINCFENLSLKLQENYERKKPCCTNLCATDA